jgi:Tfp pilus assembly protein PilF
MQPEAMWQRAILLFQQQRWELAIRELRGLLGQAPDHAPAHALLAQALARTDALDDALAAARRAVGLDPELDFAHGALAAVHWQRRELEPAAEAIRRAIDLDPDDVGHRSTLAQIRISQHRWADALAAADDGLAIDPTDTDCLNLRSLALTKLGRGAEATDSVDASLARDPDNPYTHQTRGYALLHAGDAKGALHHFQEALRRDPDLAGARAGLVEALKARNPLYRVVLRWFLWLDRFSGPRQVQIMIGLWLAARFGSEAIEQAGHATAAMVVRFSWIGFVLFTACAVPLFNLLLLLHPIGRHALERRARLDAILLGACATVGLGVGLLAWLAPATWSSDSWLFWLVFLLPVAGIGAFHAGWARTTLQVFCVACVVFWLWWSVRIEWLVADTLAAIPTGTSRQVAERDYAHLLQPLRDHADLLVRLIQATVWSTWFVLLAPKGTPRRRKGADG